MTETTWEQQAEKALRQELNQSREEYQRRVADQEAEITRVYDRLQAAHEELAAVWDLVPHGTQLEQMRKRIAASWTVNAAGDLVVKVRCDFRGHESISEGQIHHPPEDPGQRAKAIEDMQIRLVWTVEADQIEFHELTAGEVTRAQIRNGGAA